MSSRLPALCTDMLYAGRARYDAMMGIVSHIHAGHYEVFAVLSDTGIPLAGDVYPLDAVYCREVVQKKQTVAITEIDGVPGLRLHPLYDAIPCEAYISSPILVDGQVWGTLNFTSLEQRASPFSADDIAFNEQQAALLAAAILVERSGATDQV